MKFQILKGKKGYNKLNHLPFNRDFYLRPGLLESVKELGFITVIYCCYSDVINGVRTLYILDGQHRALVAQFLDIDFPIVILDEEPKTKEQLVKLTARYNNSSVAWKICVYINAYITLNYENYIVLNKVSIENGFSHRVIGCMLSDKLHDGGSKTVDKIKHGTFKVTNLKETLETLNLVKQLDELMNNSMLLSFHRLRLMNSNFNFEIFKEKFNENYIELKATTYRLYDDLFNSWF